MKWKIFNRKYGGAEESPLRPRSSRRVIALEYDPSSDTAPIVSAKGIDDQGDEILRLARRHGIPIVRRADLVETLAGIPVQESIPIELYEAVAVVLEEVRNRDTTSSATTG